MAGNEHHLFQLRIPAAEYERLRKLHKKRITTAIREKEDFIQVSMHSILLEAIAKLEQ
jgi:hypothetical protein